MGLGPQSLWPIRERRKAGFAAGGETEPISDSESRPVRLACREWRGRGLWPRVSPLAGSGRGPKVWAGRAVSAAEPDAGGAAAVAALGMGGAPAA